MNPILKYDKINLGEIFLESEINHSYELIGILIPNSNFMKFRSLIYKYNEIFNVLATNYFDKFLNYLLQKKHYKLQKNINKFHIEFNNKRIITVDANIEIVDTLMNTGMGHPIIQIKVRKLTENQKTIHFDKYRIEFSSQNNPKQVLNIYKGNKKIIEY